MDTRQGPARLALPDWRADTVDENCLVHDPPFPGIISVSAQWSLGTRTSTWERFWLIAMVTDGTRLSIRRPERSGRITGIVKPSSSSWRRLLLETLRTREPGGHSSHRNGANDSFGELSLSCPCASRTTGMDTHEPWLELGRVDGA